MTRTLVVLLVASIAIAAITASAAAIDVDGGTIQSSREESQTATIAIVPRVLNGDSKGMPVIVFINLPDGFSDELIVPSSVRLWVWNGSSYASVAASAHQPGMGSPDGAGAAGRMIWFDRASVIALLQGTGVDGEIPFEVTGSSIATLFRGKGSIVFMPQTDDDQPDDDQPAVPAVVAPSDKTDTATPTPTPTSAAPPTSVSHKSTTVAGTPSSTSP